VRSPLLLADAIVNLLLGVALIWFPPPLVRALGIPNVRPAFYASVLGAVLFGIGVALLLERRSHISITAGLGLGGAVAINLSGGIVLGVWLVAGNLQLPFRGQVFLWALVLLLVGLSSVELAVHRRHHRSHR
jgi:hypothetical protein